MTRRRISDELKPVLLEDDYTGRASECKLCKMDASTYTKEITSRVKSKDLGQQEYGLACIFHRLGNNSFSSDETTSLTSLQWDLFEKVRDSKYNGDTQKALNALKTAYHCPKVDDQVEAHRQKCIDHATKLLLEAQKLAPIRAH